MKPYGQRPPKPSTPTWVAPNNRTGRQQEREAVRRELDDTTGTGASGE